MSHFSHSESNVQGNEFIPSNTSLEPHLLHGHLEIYVKQANSLPNMDLFHKNLVGVFGKLPEKMSDKITSDPYVNVSVSGCIIARTFVIENKENPVWDQHFFVPVAHNASELHFVVKDNDFFGSKRIGFAAIPVHQLCDGHKIEGVFPILDDKRKPLELGSTLSLSIEYHPVEKMSQYNLGVGSGPEYKGIPGTYFPLRKGGKVTLYQDAHVEDGVLPDFNLDDGMVYEHGKCWSDMFRAISGAKHLVYIVGWSVSHVITLVRDSQAPSTDSQLGNLLKTKAQEGVRVLLLLWDDPTSRYIFGIKNDGKMRTYDEKTRHFFKKSAVCVILCLRSCPNLEQFVEEPALLYTHHQKTVIVDCDSGDHRRKLVAFVGGLDMCGGRYDTPSHPLFKTLQTTHKDDFHNPNYNGQTDGCPREPWHDLHCQIDGPAAYDVLANFEERWNQASKNRKRDVIMKLRRVRKCHNYNLLNIESIQEIIGIDEISSAKFCDHEGWHTQIFRSIDSTSVDHFPKDPKDAKDMNLVCGKNVLIDTSIQTAYVHAIRAAQHFIYVENQYFLGSSYNWDLYKDLGANNLIPSEIALKIASKIRAHERFAAYIILPMWPEGDPKGIPTQRILFWQYNTMQMMYDIIYKALQEAGLDDKYEPQDYLNFFCLGNREVYEEVGVQESPTFDDSPQELSKKFRRFMIYVHSKGMIVDDEYVIIGSANINQRSLDGTRDTEIAMGAYQPHHTWATKQGHPFGQIYGYRMSLWAEHLGHKDEIYMSPESLECVRRVRSLGEHNWMQFVADEVTEMRSHLLKYPLEVDRTGRVKSLPRYTTFPDFGGDIKGSPITFGIFENLTI